ncbi:MAG: hypothetical protein J6A90_08200 [Clostridia bacterium]|nr:hypothetical protein [Clostridia bacterium]
MKIKKKLEITIICIFLMIVCSALSIFIYRSIVLSDWFEENERKNEFLSDVKNLENHDEIDYVEIYFAKTNSEKYVYELSQDCFDNMTCCDYSNSISELERHQILSNDRITVFFKNGSLIDFYVYDNKLFWGNALEIKCHNLFELYLEVYKNSFSK